MGMKKFIASLCVMISLLVVPGTVFADTDMLPHVVLGNLLSISGGNKNVMIAEIKANTKPKPIKGFDTKETLRQSYEKDAKISDIYQPGKEKQAGINAISLLAGESILQGMTGTSFRDIMPYRSFTETTWADMKYRMLQTGTGAGTAIALSGKSVRKPAKNNPPSKSSLLNPNSPLTITTFDNSITLSFYDPDMVYMCEVSLLDSNGKSLGVLSENSFRKTLQPVTISLPAGKGTYYLEFGKSFGTGKGSTNKDYYYYALLNIEPDPTEPKEDRSITSAIESMRRAGQKGDALADSYMKRKGISDTGQFTESDKQTFAEEFARQEVGQQERALSEMEVISQYMKERGIASMAMLTEKDTKELQRRIMKNAALSWPDEYRAVVDSYMKQHKISGYESLTEKDMKAIEKLIGQKKTKSRKSR